MSIGVIETFGFAGYGLFMCSMNEYPSSMKALVATMVTPMATRIGKIFVLGGGGGGASCAGGGSLGGGAAVACVRGEIGGSAFVVAVADGP